MKNHSIFLGPHHVQLTLLNWDNKSVLALDEKLKFPIYVLKLPPYYRLIAFMGPDHLQLTLLSVV